MNLRVLDLFAGCGGLSVGLQKAGHTITGACERDVWASETHAANHPGTTLITKDIKDVEAGFWRDSFRGAVDLVAGGPPCQGFSVSGKRQFGLILDQNELVKEFLKVVRDVEPRFALIENVGGFKTGRMNGKERVLDYVLRTLAEMGFEARVIALQALEYGVPSLRSRLFIVGSRTGFAIDPTPTPTHSKTGKNGFQRYVSAEEALSDLPPLLARKGASDGSPYFSRAQNAFQRALREGTKGVFNHVAMNHSPRLVERFRTIPHGSSAYHIGDRDGTGEETVTVYKTNNQRLRPDQPSPCVTANFQSTHVHYRDDRTLTAREAARLMTFPDWFVFHGKRTQMSSSFLKQYGREHENHLSQYNQIGNAVPPRLAEAIGERLGQLADCDGKPVIIHQPVFNLG